MFRHILVPTDFGDSSTRAEAMARDLARFCGARLTLLHVWSVPNTGYAEGLSWPIDEMEAAAQRALDDAVARMRKEHPLTEGVLAVGPAWTRILEVIAERGVDLVVMGTHGRKGIARVVLGSVAEKVVRMSPVPVLTVGEHELVKQAPVKKEATAGAVGARS